MPRKQRAGRPSDQRKAEQLAFGNPPRADPRRALVLAEAQDRPEIDRDERNDCERRAIRQNGSQRFFSVNFI